MKKWLKYTIYTALWVGVVAYIGFAAFAVRSHRSGQRVERVNIEIVDSSAVANLVTRPMVEGWISESRIRTVGEAVDSVALSSLESHILASGFVRDVKCYTTYTGELKIKIEQLSPVLRILLNGYNAYITDDGYVFARPAASSRYTQVLTGSYSPLFRAGYTGNIVEVYDAQREELEAEVRRIEVKNIYPLYAERVTLREELREVNSRYTRRRFGESRASCDERVAALKERNAQDRARLSREIHDVAVKIERERKRQGVYKERQKKLEKKYQDFINLLIFVNVVENDKFWSSEIVQIVASEASNGALRLELIPRSGDHTIVFGRLEEIEERLDNAKTFYKEVLARGGWSQFRTINVEYKNQIVCK